MQLLLTAGLSPHSIRWRTMWGNAQRAPSVTSTGVRARARALNIARLLTMLAVAIWHLKRDLTYLLGRELGLGRLIAPPHRRLNLDLVRKRFFACLHPLNVLAQPPRRSGFIFIGRGLDPSCLPVGVSTLPLCVSAPSLVFTRLMCWRKRSKSSAGSSAAPLAASRCAPAS